MNAGVPDVKRCYKGRALLPARRIEPATRGLLLRLVLELLAVLGILGVLDALGVPSAVDGALHRRVSAMASGRKSQESVILVGVDDDTVTRWGAPPYGWDRLGPLVSAIRSGRPALVAF